MAQGSATIEAKATIGSRIPMLKSMLLVGVPLFLGFLILGVAGIQVWEYTNSVPFCTNACHDVHPEEPVAYQDSYHAQVKCTECHMGRVSTLRAMVLKSSHVRHLPAMIFDDYHRPLESATMRPANESCERCHSSSAFHDSMAREIIRFLPDQENTQKRTYLLLNTSTGQEESGGSSGSHWHVDNPLLYISADDHKQEILWVQTTGPDGETVEYDDLLNPLTPEQIAGAEKRVMDCVDCHNRIGHPFPSPETAIDQALADGRLSPDLPFAKKEMIALLTASYTSQAEALAAVASFPARYQATYPGEAGAYLAEIEQATRLAQELLPQLVFEEPGVTWQSFPDNNGHKNSPGCFRCHDGKHVTDEGESIRLQCNLCHSIPQTVDAGDEPPGVPFVALQQPASHLESNFIRDHRLLANDACVECHGELSFGRDDSSFCANSACHDQAWPLVDLDSASIHPIRLEGKHAEVTCHSCHEGVQDLEYECANCHEPPEQPHYGTECQDCHTPGGFDLASSSDFDHPIALEGKHQPLGCASCHDGNKRLDPQCATCHSPPEDHTAGACSTCHTPDGWAESALFAVSGGPSIPHAASAGLDCLACHDPAGQNWPAPSDHAAHRSEQCSVCHTAGEALLVAFDPGRVAHELAGQHKQAECRTCHVDGVFQGTTQDCVACHQDRDAHAGQLGQDCAQCHTPAGWPGAATDHALTAFPLNGAHTRAACVQCHPDNAYTATPQACVACHAQDDRHGGQLGQDCAQCHTPAGWPGTAIDHGLTAFPLSGAHTRASCVQCHPGNSYAGTPQECVVCHAQDDRHGGQFGQNCAQCHTTAGWPGAAIDHGLTAFPLSGAHTNASCVQCHTGNVYAGTPQDCVACHAADDRHGGQFGQNCAQCHTTAGWPGASIDHAQTAFQLTGAHTNASCVQCHTGNVYAGTPQDCVACHAADDRHGGQFGQNCAQCHTTAGWPGASFDHAQTAFQLTGAHTNASCVQCHAGGVYDGTPQDCVACHAADDRHGGQFGQNCAQCHTTAGWPGANFDHAQTAFQLIGAHTNASCVQCHAGGVYAGTPQNCVACHAADDQHGGQFGQNCAQCHTTAGWSGANFDHAQTAFQLTGAHTNASCVQCHAGGVYAGTPQNCVACHAADDQHRGQFGQNCAQCHTTAGWSGASFDHAQTAFQLTGAHTGASCVQCHAGGVYSGTPQDCVACHSADDRHGGQFGQNCAQCHTPAGWSGAIFDHALTAFQLTGAHTNVSCVQCHPGGVYSGTPQACVACHGEPAFHAGVLGNDCAVCHQTNVWLPAGYPRSHTFPFNHGGGGSNQCRTCHSDTLAAFNCYNCHEHQPAEIAEEHREEGITDLQNCVSCHPTGREG